MRLRRAGTLLLAWAALVVSALPGHVAPAYAAEYTLESAAAYDVRPEEGVIGVTVGLSFTNTTPDPAGQFSIFSEIKIAIHDAATEVAATDEEGDLTVSVAVESEVNVATIELREDLRFEETATLELTYSLPDSENPQQRVRPSVVVFPAWSFGTAGEVSVSIPNGYELRVDGDPLTEDGDRLTSGPIPNPGEWLALVTAIRPAEYTDFSATVPLDGGTADLLVRSFADDEAWGERTLALVQEALPIMEQELGLPYPRIGQLILTESVSAHASGFGEAAPTGAEILVAFDQPPFTALHEVAHVWLSPTLIEDRWIREGMASDVAARVAERLEVEPPYDPAAETQARAAAAFRLDTWGPSGTPDSESYGYAASWAFVDELETAVGADALRAVLARVAASVGPYESGDIDPEPAAPGGGGPTRLLDTRSFLDHLETVTDVDAASLFRDRVLTEEDAALLEPRAAARAAFDELVAAADSWGAPDPVRAAMSAWEFEDATGQIATAAAWLDERDTLLEQMEAAGLSAPDRLQQAYRANGGGPEAADELDAERAVVEEYTDAAEEVNAERSFIQRIGLVGSPDPQAELTLASGRFADGDLRGAFDAIGETRRIVESAESAGIVRLASLALLVAILVTVAVVLFRRRASYTAAP
jgi:hypothetical protein